MEIIKIAITAVIGALLALALKPYHPLYSLYIILATGVLLLFYCFDGLTLMIQLITKMASVLEGQAIYLKILGKLIGIAYISEFASDICIDAGYQALSSQMQMLGKLAILVAAIPLFTSLIETIEEVL